MLNSVDLLSFILAFGVLYFMFAFLSKLRQQDVFKDRLRELMLYKEKMIKEDPTAKKIYQRKEEQKFLWLRQFINKFQRLGKKEQNSLKKTFIRAGLRPDNASLIYGVAKICMIFPPAVLAAFFIISPRGIFYIRL